MSSQEEDLLQMRKLVLEAEESLLKAKEIANRRSFTFVIGTSTYDGSLEDWVNPRESDEYWQSSSMNC